MATRRHVNTYRSGLEDKAIKLLESRGIEHSYETLKLKYIKPQTTHTYTPDIIIGDKIYETKGIFSLEDRKKMKFIKEQHPHLDITMVFQRNQKINKTSKTLYGDWCTKNGIKWMTYKDFENMILKQTTKTK